MVDVTANGIRFNVVIEGPEGAPWITFSNSHATDLTIWDQQAALLSDRFRVLRYDTRGHGKTEATKPPYDIAMLESDVIALWDALNIERSHMVGLSLGGSTGIGMAINHGDRIISLLGSDCRAWASKPDSWNARIKIAEDEGLEGAVPATISRWFTAAYVEENPPALEKVRNMIRNTSLDGYIGCARVLQTIDYTDRLGEITCPVQFLAGDSDPAASPESISKITDMVPGAKFDIVPDAAHIPNIQNPGPFNAFMTKFFDGS
ncbi:MAG: alpha/beta fold hydrolase [Rhodospirillaceae bacterium]|jgi:3-oxoadipate enol-lactonase|nr:alpha/beta fold hydrolase [Rhodospirillaceae bacterium]